MWGAIRQRTLQTEREDKSFRELDRQGASAPNGSAQRVLREVGANRLHPIGALRTAFVARSADEFCVSSDLGGLAPWRFNDQGHLAIRVAIQLSAATMLMVTTLRGQFSDRVELRVGVLAVR